MEKLTVSKVIANYDKSFDGKPLISSLSKKPYKTAKVYFNETKDKAVKVTKWDNVEVKVGDEFMGKVVEKEYQGKKYFQLEVPKKDEVVAGDISQIKFSLAKHDHQIKEIMGFIEDFKKGKSIPNFHGTTPSKRTPAEQIKVDLEGYPDYGRDVREVEEMDRQAMESMREDELNGY